MASVNDLSEPILGKIFGHLGPKDCLSASLVQRSWRGPAVDERIWRKHCEEDFGVLHKNSTFPSFMCTYSAWQRELGKYGVLAKRAHLAWEKIEKFCQREHPLIMRSLRPGASEEVLDKVEKLVKHSLPAAFRVLYRFHDGQDIYGSTHSLHGLFGWFGVYGNLHCTAMLPIGEVAKACVDFKDTAMAFFGADIMGQAPGRWSLRFCSRKICIDVKTGAPYIVSARRLQNAVQSANEGGVLEWFEAYADALDTGYYQVTHIADDSEHPGSEVAGISLIPRRPPGQVSAVTRGVRVSASVIFMPNEDHPLVAGGKFGFAYRHTLICQITPQLMDP